MSIVEFIESLKKPNPPAGLDPLLLALWYDAKGDWQKSHSIIQDIETKDAALTHSYLHRKEGDQWNAAYWYSRAGTQKPNGSLEEERKSLLHKFLLNLKAT
jgi:hypothetical protein